VPASWPLGVAHASFSDDPTVLIRACVGGLASLAGYWLLPLVSRGGLGFGDFKLSGVLGFAVSALSLTALWWSLMRGSAAADVWAVLLARCSQNAAREKATKT